MLALLVLLLLANIIIFILTFAKKHKGSLKSMIIAILIFVPLVVSYIYISQGNIKYYDVSFATIWDHFISSDNLKTQSIIIVIYLFMLLTYSLNQAIIRLFIYLCINFFIVVLPCVIVNFINYNMVSYFLSTKYFSEIVTNIILIAVILNLVYLECANLYKLKTILTKGKMT